MEDVEFKDGERVRLTRVAEWLGASFNFLGMRVGYGGHPQHVHGLPAGTYGSVRWQDYPLDYRGNRPKGQIPVFVPDDAALQPLRSWCYLLHVPDGPGDQYARAGIEKI